MTAEHTPDELLPADHLLHVRMEEGYMTWQPLAPDDPRHGTRNAYSNLGCHCPACTAANTAHCAPAIRRRRSKFAAAGLTQRGTVPKRGTPPATVEVSPGV